MNGCCASLELLQEQYCMIRNMQGRTCTNVLVPGAQDGLHDHEWNAVWVSPASSPESHRQVHVVQVGVVDAHL